MTLSGSHTVLANGTTGYNIGELSVKDPDIDQTHIITTKGPNSDFIKAIQPSSLFNINNEQNIWQIDTLAYGCWTNQLSSFWF